MNMDMKDITKRAAAGTAMAGALGLGILGFGSGAAVAKPGHPGPQPNPPGPIVTAPADLGHGNGNGWGNGNVGDVDDENDDGVGGRMGGGWKGGNIDSAWLPGMPPGQNPFGPPGQLKAMADLTFDSAISVDGVSIPAGTVLPNPFQGVAPGHWGSVNLASVFNTTAPSAIRWLAPGALTPQPLVWNPTGGVDGQGAWGVTVNGVFTPYPIQLPAPMSG